MFLEREVGALVIPGALPATELSPTSSARGVGCNSPGLLRRGHMTHRSGRQVCMRPCSRNELCFYFPFRPLRVSSCLGIDTLPMEVRASVNLGVGTRWGADRSSWASHCWGFQNSVERAACGGLFLNCFAGEDARAGCWVLIFSLSSESPVTLAEVPTGTSQEFLGGA